MLSSNFKHFSDKGRNIILRWMVKEMIVCETKLNTRKMKLVIFSFLINELLFPHLLKLLQILVHAKEHPVSICFQETINYISYRMIFKLATYNNLSWETDTLTALQNFSILCVCVYKRIQSVLGIKVTISGFNSVADSESKTPYTRGSDS